MWERERERWRRRERESVPDRLRKANDQRDRVIIICLKRN